MQWRSLAQILDSQFAKTTGLWFAIVPFLAHASSAPAFAWIFQGFKLPFSWGLFFAAACGMFVARLLFLIYCPTVIRDYRSWQDFEIREGGSSEQLKRHLSDALARTSLESAKAFLEGTTRGLAGYATLPEGHIEQLKTIDNLPLVISNLTIRAPKEIFASVSLIANSLSPTKRWVVTIVTSLSILFLSIVGLQNIFAVACAYKLLPQSVCATSS